ncbi:MAG TPA: hypothetical protein VI893_07840 [Thermoplasmata archaeon]|nr:hypothetical protein [Thermoplasmata archaeon]
MDLNGKKFRVVRNDGDSPETTEGTIVSFTQKGDLVFAEWSGGLVRTAQLVGVIQENHIRHAYMLINVANEIRAGAGTIEVESKSDGKLRLVESWDWTDPPGRGLCTMEEV